MTSRMKHRFDLRAYRKKKKNLLNRLALELYGQEEHGKTLAVILMETIHALKVLHGVSPDHDKDTHSQS
jgi:hypothetical protein